MVVWSAVRPLLTSPASRNAFNTLIKRNMSEHRTFPLQPSKWQWDKFKDLFQYYAMIGVIPLGALVLYVNVFIGPATLAEIPEGYEPKYWEYYRHPITRFIARYLLDNPQQDYEKFLHYVFEAEEKRRMRILVESIKEKMSERNDYQAYFYRPVVGKYLRIARSEKEKVEKLLGD